MAGQLVASVDRGDGARADAVVWDLSQSGMAIATGENLKEGEGAVVEFCLAGKPVRATCRVANSRKGSGGKGYVVGMEFILIERPVNRELPGEMLDPAEVMAGAETGHVNDVAERLQAAMKSPL